MADHQPPAINLGAQAAPLRHAPVPQAQIPPAAVPVTLPLRHRTFTNFYSDPSKDPFRDRYASILRRFDAIGPDSQDADTLLEPS